MVECEEIMQNSGNIDTIKGFLGEEADYLLNHSCQKISMDSIHVPGPDFVDRIFVDTDRSTQVLRNLKLG